MVPHFPGVEHVAHSLVSYDLLAMRELEVVQFFELGLDGIFNVIKNC